MRRLAPMLAAVSLAGLAAACDAVDAAPTPAATLNFPISLALSMPVAPDDEPEFVLVGNADYDLRFDQGSLQSYALDEIEAEIDACSPECRPCVHERPADAVVLCEDGTVLPGTFAPVIADEVLVGPHMAGMAMSPRGDRVYLPSRGERGLTWVDVDPTTGALDCEGNGEPERCAERRRSTIVSDACARTPTFLGDPAGVVVGSVELLTGNADDADDDYVIVAHRGGAATLFLEREAGGAREPVLVHRLEGLPVDLMNLTLDPTSGVAWANSATINSARRSRDIALIGVDYDQARPECSAGFAAGRVFLPGLDDGLDTRDIAFSPEGDNRFVHVLSRRPEAIVTLDLDGRPLGAGETLISAIQPTGFGPSRMDVADIGGRRIIAVTAFDARNVWIYDATDLSILGVVPGFSGVFELVIDPVRQLLVVGDFRDSVLRVVDLSPLDPTSPNAGQPLEIALRIGVVRPVSVLR